MHLAVFVQKMHFAVLPLRYRFPFHIATIGSASDQLVMISKGDREMRYVKTCGLAFVVGLALAAAPARADLIADGITYQLQGISGLNTTNAFFNLHITGINAAADTEKGRFGVESFTFNSPANFLSAIGPAGFSFVNGGLNSSGCNGSGNFFCFDGPTPGGPALPANSTLDFAFSVTLSSGNFLTYSPDFKINWVGTKNNYDLVSLPITVGVPSPIVGAGLPGMLLALGGMVVLARRRRQRHTATF
jgi:hypothetical protein